MAIHTGEKYQCNICGRSYSQKHHLKNHPCLPSSDGNGKKRNNITLEQASSEKVNCEICNKGLSKDYINTHMRIHKGEKTKICKVSGIEEYKCNKFKCSFKKQ